MKTYYRPAFHLIELCLTYRCNIRCNNCSNLCTQAPFTGDLTPADVQKFFDDSDKNNHIWGHITIHGGEPILNPYTDEIIRLLVEYRKRTGCILWLLTNNSNEVVQKRITKISCDYDIALGISTKVNGKQIEYIPVNRSPVDSGEAYTRGCFQTETCGICFNYLGYFPCSPMAAAARVFNLPPVAKSIKELTDDVCQIAFKERCMHCGFATQPELRTSDQVTTKTWDDHLKKYKEVICQQ